MNEMWEREEKSKREKKIIKAKAQDKGIFILHMSRWTSVFLSLVIPILFLALYHSFTTKFLSPSLSSFSVLFYTMVCRRRCPTPSLPCSSSSRACAALWTCMLSKSKLRRDPCRRCAGGGGCWLLWFSSAPAAAVSPPPCCCPPVLVCGAGVQEIWKRQALRQMKKSSICRYIQHTYTHTHTHTHTHTSSHHDRRAHQQDQEGNGHKGQHPLDGI